MGRQSAADWATQNLPLLGQHDFSLFKEMWEFAYSPGGLDMGRQSAADWAVDKIKVGITTDEFYDLKKRVEEN